MTSRRWSTFVSGLVLTLTLGRGRPRPCTMEFPVYTGPLGRGMGSRHTITGRRSTPVRSARATGTGIASGFRLTITAHSEDWDTAASAVLGFSTLPGYAQASGQRPRDDGFVPVKRTCDVVTSVPGSGRSNASDSP